MRCAAAWAALCHLAVAGVLAEEEKDKCWRKMPSGCDNVLSEPGSGGSGLHWFDDFSSPNQARCMQRVADFDTYCGRADALSYWGKYSALLQDAAVNTDRVVFKLDVGETNDLTEPGFTNLLVPADATLTAEGAQCNDNPKDWCLGQAIGAVDMVSGINATVSGYSHRRAYGREKGYDNLVADCVLNNRGGTTVIQLAGIPAGDYSVKTYHNNADSYYDACHLMTGKGAEASNVKKVYFRGNSEKKVQDSSVAVFHLTVDRTGTMVFKMVYNTGHFPECAGVQGRGHASFNGLVVTRLVSATSSSTTTTAPTVTTATTVTSTITATTATSTPTATTTLIKASNISNSSDTIESEEKKAAAAVVVPIIVLLFVLAAGLLWRRYTVQRHEETVRANHARRELDGADVLEMVENPLRRSTAGAGDATTGTVAAALYHNTMPANDGNRGPIPNNNSNSDCDDAGAGMVGVATADYNVPNDVHSSAMYQPPELQALYSEPTSNGEVYQAPQTNHTTGVQYENVDGRSSTSGALYAAPTDDGVGGVLYASSA